MKDKTQENTSVAVQGKVVIDVRFHPNGLVNMINHRPANMEPQDWFDFLCRQSTSYRPLAGGRGTFAIPAERFEEICALKEAAEWSDACEPVCHGRPRIKSGDGHDASCQD